MKIKKMLVVVWCVLLLTGMLTGCATVTDKPRHSAEFAPVRPMPIAKSPINNGSIYQLDGSESLFDDIKPHRVGDILTVKLQESTNASKSASSDAKKEGALALGQNFTIGGKTPGVDEATGDSTPVNISLLPGHSASRIRVPSLSTTMDNSHEFKGSGKSSQSNSFQGDITVTVVEVLPNKNLVVRGEKRLTINQGEEYIRFSGIVRPADIAEDNTIVSTKVADTTITYTGAGMVANANESGFASSVLFKFWPF